MEGQLDRRELEALILEVRAFERESGWRVDCLYVKPNASDRDADAETA
jgi:hypothetical protein